MATPTTLELEPPPSQPRELVKVKGLVGASPSFDYEIYSEASMDQVNDQNEDKNQLRKQGIENADKIVRTLKDYFGPTCLVWMSKTLPTDLNLPVIGKPPFEILQTFIIPEKHPPILLSLHDSGNDEKLRPYAVEICRMIPWSVHDFCYTDFVVVPCFVPLEQLTTELPRKIEDGICDAEQFFPDPVHSDQGSYRKLKKATQALARSTFVPSLLENKRGKVHVELMDADLGNLTSKITEILHSQREFSVTNCLAVRHVKNLVDGAITKRFQGHLLKDMLSANENMDDTKTQFASLEEELEDRVKGVARRAAKTANRQKDMAAKILESCKESGNRWKHIRSDPRETFRLRVAALEAGKRVSIREAVRIDCGSDEILHCISELKRLWKKHNNRELKLYTGDDKKASYHIDLQDRIDSLQDSAYGRIPSGTQRHLRQNPSSKRGTMTTSKPEIQARVEATKRSAAAQTSKRAKQKKKAEALYAAKKRPRREQGTQKQFYSGDTKKIRFND